eukprot:snap_masked-scaffold_1-processed-gene-21.35-mRNA-1 protein AED:1.00 eAED:1.00 QI:0/0/0/0/1/1/2/0/142
MFSRKKEEKIPSLFPAFVPKLKHVSSSCSLNVPLAKSRKNSEESVYLNGKKNKCAHLNSSEKSYGDEFSNNFEGCKNATMNLNFSGFFRHRSLSRRSVSHFKQLKPKTSSFKDKNLKGHLTHYKFLVEKEISIFLNSQKYKE